MGLGAVCHTLNPRLFLADLEYIMNHAEDKIVMFDLDLAGVIAKLRPKLATVQRLVALTDRQHMHKVVSPFSRPTSNPVSRPARALARFLQESSWRLVCTRHVFSALCACAYQEGLGDQVKGRATLLLHLGMPRPLVYNCILHLALAGKLMPAEPCWDNYQPKFDPKYPGGCRIMGLHA